MGITLRQLLEALSDAGDDMADAPVVFEDANGAYHALLGEPDVWRHGSPDDESTDPIVILGDGGRIDID